MCLGHTQDVQIIMKDSLSLALSCHLYAHLTQIYTQPLNMKRYSNVKSHTISTAWTNGLEKYVYSQL